MPTRLRGIVIALGLCLGSSAAGILLYLDPNPSAPLAHEVIDYAVHIRALSYAHYFGLHQPPRIERPNSHLGLIAIDENSIGSPATGPWPFPRSLYGRLLDRLAAAGAKTVAFDISFLEPSVDPRQDAAFAAGMRRVPTVLGDIVATTATGRIGVEPVTPALARASAAVGYTSVDQPGGYVIGQPPEIRTRRHGTYGGEVLRSLALAAVETYTGKSIDVAGVPTLNGRLMLLPMAAHSGLAIGHRAGAERFGSGIAGAGQLSFATAVTMPISQLRTFAAGRLILVGATAQALGDFVTTARGITPGMYVNARFIDQLLRGLSITPASPILDLALILMLPLLVTLALTFLRPVIGIIASVTMLAAFTEVNLWFFVEHLYWIDLIHVGLATLLAMMLVGGYRASVEVSQRRLVTQLFGMHVSPAIVREILSADDPRASLGLHGKRVKTTIFYSDIRGFTAMSETMTPEQIYAQLNEYFDEMCEIIFRHNGYVDKFIGDCVMAVFSAPYQTENDARNAVISAVEQQRRISELATKWQAEGRSPFTVGMGINTGEVVMGNLGARSRMNYTVIGDNVNVAARLYNVAKGGQIIISESTYEEVRDVVTVNELEPVHVKGKTAPLRIYEIVDLKEPFAAC
ncbi:MAG: CHASE2 domain-containing protein [Vulcanimicrobiaceae bacterium]